MLLLIIGIVLLLIIGGGVWYGVHMNNVHVSEKNSLMKDLDYMTRQAEIMKIELNQYQSVTSEQAEMLTVQIKDLKSLKQLQ